MIEENIGIQVTSEIREPSEESDDDSLDICVGCYLFQPPSVENGSIEWVRCSRYNTFSHPV